MTAPTSPAKVVGLGLGGPALAQLRQFYGDVFNWPPGDNPVQVPVTSFYLTFSGAPGGTTAYLNAADIDASLAMVIAHLGEPGMRPTLKDSKGVSTTGFFVDPGGNQMALAQGDAAPGPTGMSVIAIGGIIAQLPSFYEAVFGWPVMNFGASLPVANPMPVTFVGDRPAGSSISA